MHCPKESPLHIAAGYGNVHIINILIDHGVGVDVTDRWGNAPLSQCVRAKHHRAARMLKNESAKLQTNEMHAQTVWERRLVYYWDY